jgi:hypothetical protein
MSANDLPTEVLTLVLDNLVDDKALHACTLVSQAFHEPATKLLYRCLNSRIAQQEYGVSTSAVL